MFNSLITLASKSFYTRGMLGNFEQCTTQLNSVYIAAGRPGFDYSLERQNQLLVSHIGRRIGLFAESKNV